MRLDYLSLLHSFLLAVVQQFTDSILRRVFVCVHLQPCFFSFMSMQDLTLLNEIIDACFPISLRRLRYAVFVISELKQCLSLSCICLSVCYVLIQILAHQRIIRTKCWILITPFSCTYLFQDLFICCSQQLSNILYQDLLITFFRTWCSICPVLHAAKIFSWL